MSRVEDIYLYVQTIIHQVVGSAGSANIEMCNIKLPKKNPKNAELMGHGHQSIEDDSRMHTQKRHLCFGRHNGFSLATGLRTQ